MKTVKTFGKIGRFLKPLAVLFTAGILITLFYSCEIGLGAAVDTQPPKIEIQNPPVDAVIRDNFALGGTFDDDGSIKSVKAVLTRIGSEEKIEITDFDLVKDPVEKGAGTWTIPVNALDNQGTKLIADGSYQASITIKDNAGRETIQNTTFTVDNTPPVLILQRPATDVSVINEDDIDTFGKTFTLEGRAADDNNIDHIDIKIFSDPQKTDLIHTVTLKNVPLSIALEVAKWGDENYEKIYGSTSQEGAKKRYCSIEAYDSSQRYPADGTTQTAEDKNGNFTTDYYLYNDIADSAVANYKVTELYSIMSGNYSGDGSRNATDVISSVKTILNSIKKDSGYFKLNPLNNPTYKLSGWTSTEDFITFEDSSITMDVEPGLDGIAVDKSSLKVYLIKLDDSGNPTGGKIYPDADDVKITGASSFKVAVKINRKKAKNAAGQAITYSYGSYLVGVEGFDKTPEAPNELMPENLPYGSQGYKIDIQNVGAAPDLTVNYEVNGEAASGNIIYLPKNKVDTDQESEIIISCTVEDSKEEVPEFQILLDDKSIGVSKTDLVKDTVNSTLDKFIYTYSGTIKFSQIQGFDTTTSKQHTITVTVSNGSPTADRKTFMYDVDNPVVEIRNVTPVATKYDASEQPLATQYLNGSNIEVSVSFTDAFDVVDLSNRKPKIEFVQGSTVKTIADGITELSYKKTGVSTQMEGLTNGPVTIRVTAYDRSGNKTVETKDFVIDQDTDLPVIIHGDNSISNTWDDISGGAQGRKNVFNLGGQFLLKFADDDGLDKYSVYSVKTTTGSEEKPTSPDTGLSNISINGNEYQFTWKLPTTSGFYKVWIDVTDKVEKVKKAGPFFVQVASGVPVISIENERYVTTVTDAAALTDDASKNPLKVKLSIESMEGPFVIRRAEITEQNPDPTKEQAGAPIATNVTVNEYTDNYTVSSSKDDGEYKLKYFVTDKNNNTGEKIATYKLDKTAPSIISTKLDGNSLTEESWYKSDTMELKIDANDGNKTVRSEISTIEYSLDNTDWTALTKRDGSYIRTVTFANGSNTLYIHAIDNVGNKKSETKNLKIDVTAPEFSINTTGDYIYINDASKNLPLVLNGSYKDEQSGVKELVVKLDGQTADVTYSITQSGEYKDYSAFTDNEKNTIRFWRAEFSVTKLNAAFADTTTQQLLVTGSNICDTAIPSSYIPNITVMKDIGSPTFDNIGLNSSTGKGVYKESNTSYFASTTLGTSFTLTGIAKDTGSGVKQVACSINNVAQTPVTTAGWIFDIPLAATDGLTKTVSVTVTDNAGNTYTYPDITVTVDNTAPVGEHKVDAKGKDIVFRIGNNDNDDIGPENTASNPAHNVAGEDIVWNDAIDKDVGGKYSDGTYGNAETIKLRGFFDDNKYKADGTVDITGSGVDLIYYKVFKTQPTEGNQLAEKFLKDGDETYETQANGYFSLITPVEKRVFYTHTDGSNVVDYGGKNFDNKKYYIDNVKYNFYTTISGLSSGENYLVFVAVDKVGNASLESVEIDGETYNNYKINVDQVPPTVPNDKIYTPTLFFNTNNTDAENIFKVYGLVNDEAAGIREAGVKINGTELFGVYKKDESKTYLYDKEDEATRKHVGYLTLTTSGTANITDATAINGTTLSSNTSLWEIDLNKDAFAGITSGNSASVSLKVTDNAGGGNSETYPVANVKIDTEGPTVTVNCPTTNVNGKISLSVTANDNNGAGLSTDNPVLYKKNGNNWEVLDTTLHPFANGKFTIDTTKFTDNADTTLKVEYKDIVKNTGSSSDLVLSVKQDADRPIITLSQLDATEEVTLRLKNVYGSVIDDDGNVKKMWYWSTQKHQDNSPTEAPTASDDKGWSPITVNGGSWSVDTTNVEKDGETTWYFAVQDNEDKIFWIGNGENNTPVQLNQPYFKYKTGDEQNVTGGITFKYDTDAPKITDFWLYKMETPGQGETALTVNQIMSLDNDADDDNDPAWTNKRDTVFGKDYKLLYAKIIVDEGTEMKEFSGTNGSAPTSSPITINYKQTEDVEYSYNKEQLICVHEDTSTIYTYYLGPIVMDTTEKTDFTVTAYDGVGLSGSSKISIIVDNAPPTGISRVRPNSAGEVSGDVTYTGSADDDTQGGSGVTNVEWCIPTKTQSQGAATQNGLTWRKATYNATWEIDFAGDYNLSTIIGYTTASGTPEVNANYTGYETGSETGVYLIPVWFKLTDAVGNIGYDTTNGLLRYNPNTDRPSVLIGNPTHNKTAVFNKDTVNEYSINYVVMGGSNARISGSADDNEGVGSVYLQFDLDADGHWDTGVKGLSADLNTEPTNSTELIDGTPWTYDKIEKIVTKKNGVQTAEFGYGIKVGTTKSWSYTLDLSDSALKHITETEISTGVYSYSGETIRIRAIAIDNDDQGGQLASAWSDVLNVSVNNEIPLFSNLKIKQIKNGTTISELDYVDGKYLKGDNWYITGDVGTNNGLSEASYTGVTNALSCFTLKNGSTTQYDMKIPVNPTNGVWDVEIFVYDNTTPTKKQGSQKIKINIDNTSPNFADEYEASQYAVNGTVKHYLNNYGSKGTEITPSIDIIDENELISLWGSVKDSGSGFAKAVFYFKRLDANGSSNPRVYNPMSDSNNRTNLNGSKAVGKVYIDNSEGGDNLPALYVKTDATAKMTVSRPGINSIKVVLEEGSTVTGVTNNGNIRKGGLIKIGGVYRTITDIAGDGTVTFDTECDTSFVEAEFIYALVVDSTGETKSGNTINEQDGDGVWENYTILPDGTATWNAAFTTSNIPDGPVELHVVVFDEAGNFNHGYTKAKICNNPLRITKVMFGTDLNGDGNYNIDTEFEKFYAYTQSTGSHDLSKGLPVWDLDTKKELGGSSYYTVKKGLAVIPEFVGGTGDVYYKFEKRENKLTAAQTIDTTNDSNKLKAAIDSITGTISAEQTGNNIGKLVLVNGTINTNTREDVMSYFSFSFWDSMEAATAGTNSSCTVLNAQIKQDLVDNKKPNIVIEPFRWGGEGEEGKDIKTEIVRKFTYSTVKGNKGYARNDFYTDADCTVPVNSDTADNAIVYTKQGVSVNSLYKTLRTNGHIELSEDLPSETFSSTGLYDKDPKISGKITFSGTAYDDVGLSSIWFSFDGFTPTGYYSATDKYGANGKKTGVTVAQDVTKDFYQAAYYNPSSGWQLAGAKVDEGNTPAGWEFTVENEYFNQNGHKVRWILSIDTSKIDGVADTDKTLYVLAVDHNAETAGTNTTTVSVFGDTATNSQLSADDGTNVTKYKVDVVPYITEISTELSEGNKKRPTVLSRSALGVYPVRRDSKLTVKGYNFNGTSTGISIGGTAYTPQTGTTTNAILIDTTKPVTQNATLASGEVIATVNTVVSLNNKTAKSVTSGNVTRLIEYNQEPNGQNNDLLNDKREVWVVDVTTTNDVKDKRKLDMVISGTAITFGSGYQDSYYSTMVANGTALSNIQNLRNSFTRYFDSAIDANDDGTIFTVSSCGDTYMGPVTQWTNGPSHFALTRGNAGTGKAAAIWEYDRKSSSDSGYTPSTNVSKIYLESNWNGSNLNNLERFLWPDIVVTGGNSATKGYISYYDTTQKLIKFRYFTSDGSKVANNLASYQAGNTSDTIVEGAVNTNTTYSQGYVAIAGANENSQYSVVGVTSNGTALVSWYDAANGALKMKYNTSPGTSFSGYQDFSTVPGTGTITFDIKVDGGSSKSVSVTWSNVATGTRNNHEFAYQLNQVLSNGYGAYAEVDPKTNRVTVRSMQTGTSSSIAITNLKRNGGNNNAGAVNTAVPGAGVAWVEKAIDEDSAGQFVAMKTDSKGGIHFAYYDTGNGDLKYAYMSSVTATPVVVTVDGYQQVGQYVDLAVKETSSGNTTSVTPYISYYSMSNADTKRAAKVAKLVSPIVYTTTGTGENTTVTSNSSAVKAGSVDELFTGSWEAFHVPTAGIPVQYRVNIGVTTGGNVYISYLADRIIEYVKVE